MTGKIITATVILLVLFAAYNLLAQITDALKSQDRLSAQAEAVFKLEVKNRQLKEKLSQIKSVGFIEQQARDKLGLGKSGETIVIIPEEKLKSVLGASESAKIRLPNWLGWFKVFLK